jgi:N4-(beta-N-acetylglucosaminyl)-L-asparaginase
MEQIDRRRFLVTGTAAAAALAGIPRLAMSQPDRPPPPPAQPRVRRERPEGDEHRGPVVIASANGLAATARAMELSQGGEPLLESIVTGVKIIEDDPRDNSVGYGGLPNEEGVVQLDASVMDGRLHRAGAVGCLERIKNPAAVALQVMRKTDHVMLVGEGALRFARAMGFQEENLLTDESRRAWLQWKANLNPGDKWLDSDQQIRSGRVPRADLGPDGVPYTTGTVHVSGVDAEGNVASCTSTSGLSWKLPGRLGDSPIVGAGMYCDNAIGSAGATGRGEAVIQVCGAFAIVELMDRGLTPTEACLEVLKRIADRTREGRLLDERGRPAFNVTFYAARKDGAFGAAAMWKGAQFAVSDGRENRRQPAAWLFEKENAPDPVTNR